jgi:hypothetical protein
MCPDPSGSTLSFETISPALAAALIAGQQLAYAHAKMHTNRKDVVYVFDDPLRVGAELQRRYNAGVLPAVHAKAVNEARGYLAEECKRVKGGSHAKS